MIARAAIVSGLDTTRPIILSASSQDQENELALRLLSLVESRPPTMVARAIKLKPHYGGVAGGRKGKPPREQDGPINGVLKTYLLPVLRALCPDGTTEYGGSGYLAAHP